MLFIYFLLGTIIGSFLNVCILRIPLGQDIVFSRSQCPHCHRQLSARELVPIFSFIFLKGQCRYCQKPIAWQYPVVEALSGFLLIFTILRWGFKVEAFYNYLFFAVLIIIAFIDYFNYVIPNNLVVFLLIISLINPNLNINKIFTSFFIAFIFFTIYFIFQGKIGGGDVKLLTVFALWFGYPDIILVIFLASLLGLLIALFWIIIKKISLQDPVPFGFFLAQAAFVNMAIGKDLWNWYLGKVLGVINGGLPF